MRDLRKQKNVVIPDGAQEIGERWFENSEAESVTIPASVKEVASDAFRNCDALKMICVEDGCDASLINVDLPDSVLVGPPPETMVGNARVWDLRDCKEVVVPEGVEKIGNQWFWGSKIETVEIPASVREIGADAFGNCSNLKCVTFANGSQLEKIGGGCFYGTGMKELMLPSALEYVGDKAFGACRNLETIRLEGERDVDLSRAGLQDLTDVILPSVALPGGVFLQDLRQTKNIAIPEGTEKIGNNWFRNSEIESVDIPASVREIGENAFHGCRCLKSVTFAAGSKLEKIGACCFYKSGIKMMTVPKGVADIRRDTFMNCH